MSQWRSIWRHGNSWYVSVFVFEWRGYAWDSVSIGSTKELCGMVELDREDAVALDVKMMFMFTLLFKQSEWHMKSHIHYFSVVLGYNLASSQWRLPVHYTPILAGVQYCIRVIMLQHALPRDERKNYWRNNTKDPLERFREIRDEWLVSGKPSPFRHVHSLMNYGMGSAKNSGGIGRDDQRTINGCILTEGWRSVDGRISCQSCWMRRIRFWARKFYSTDNNLTTESMWMIQTYTESGIISSTRFIGCWTQ